MPRHNKPIKYIRTSLSIDDNCRSKRRFSSEKEAQKAAELQMLIDTNLELSVYVCNFCHKWHLTRLKK